MQSETKLLIFTDMDGSLLCHDTYSHAAADDLLTELEQRGIPVIPTTSKTQAELLHLRTELNNDHPFIAENGAAVFIPVNYFSIQPEGTELKNNYWVKEFVHNRNYWQSLLEHISSVDASTFTPFSALTTSEIAELTGLDNDAASRAAQRLYGEPIVWQGNDEEKERFVGELRQMGANVLSGGRFIHVSGKCDKGKAMLWLTQLYENNVTTGDSRHKTIAIGDSQNDVAMLNIADYALLIKSPVNPFPTLDRQSNTYMSEQCAPLGWAQGVRDILNEKIDKL